MECAVVPSGHTEAIWLECAHLFEASERRGSQWNTLLRQPAWTCAAADIPHHILATLCRHTYMHVKRSLASS
eukprot:358949-Chlamydomonas_euryale.AAC.7